MADLSWTESLKQELGTGLISFRESAPGEAEFKIKKDALLSFLEKLKNLSGGSFEHLADLTAYDEHPKSPRYHVVYELISMMKKQRCSVVVPLEDQSPSVSTVTSLWKGANWLEREVYDMYGIQFEGHPDHRRILMPEAFRGHPLRKDFIVDYRQDFPKAKSDAGLFDPSGSTIIPMKSEAKDV